MPITFEESQAAITRLVKHFLTNRETYRAPAYKEAHARQEFIDPLFVALGWDVANAQQAAPDYREVVVEDTVEIAGQKKAPDYVFRVGRERKFFVEAKKPGVDLKQDASPAYQLRRYAWTAKLPLSLLTDFEELAVYDCRARPTDKDKASAGRLHYFTCETYGDHWREIWDLFSREAVWGGAFDKFATASGGKRGVATVDAEFLKEIEGWRETLARNIALRNERLSVDEVNDAVQRTIDRLIFLRMAEDRGIEDYGRLQHQAEGDDIYRGLIRTFRHADARYNSGLFDFSKAGDTLTPNLTIDDKVLRPIITSLYFPQSPYEFSVLPVEILGNIYEQFLGKVIRLTSGHQAKVEEKPEVKKAGGVHYTPTYIAEYIVRNTVGVAVAGRTPPQLRGFRTLDPACGSGSILLCAYQYLLDYYLSWYIANAPEKHPKAVWKLGEAWRLTTAERKRILIEHIFGVDIDRQAVEVTKLSLLLKVLETESDESLGKQLALLPAKAKERVLPNLDHNIKCGNSLIGPDYFTGQLLPDADELRRVNPFDWAAEFPQVFSPRPAGSLETRQVWGGFDCVIGNPPYIRMESFKDLKSYLKTNYASHDERSDLYAYFIELAHKVLKTGGQFGMIVSNKFLRANYGRPLREFLRQNAHIARITDFAGLPVFAGVTVRTIILLTIKQAEANTPTLYSPPLPENKFAAVVSGSIPVEQAIKSLTHEVSSQALGQPVWSFSKQDTGVLLSRLRDTLVPLTQYCEGAIGYGIKSGLEEAFVIDEATRKRLAAKTTKITEIIKPYLNGRDIRRYSVEFQNNYLIYTYHGVPIHDYPTVENYLKSFKAKLQKRATKQEWYELQQPQFNYTPYFKSRKIVFPDIALAPRFALDEVGYYGSTTTFFIGQDNLYLLGLLNSHFSKWYFTEVCAALEGKKDRYLRFKRQYVEGFPIRPINFSDPADKARHDQMVMLVEQMLDLHKRLAATAEAGEQSRLQRLIDSTDGQIDALVYELYGLTAEEVAVVSSG